MAKYYAGIGSRETPLDVLQIMKASAVRLSTDGYTLRSGRAKGADSWFEMGATDKEIFTAKSDIPLWAFATVDQYHPNPSALSDYAKRLHARNAMILIGESRTTPADFVICWTKDGKDTGGTGQAIRLAKDENIPIYNLFYKDVRDSFVTELKDYFS